MDHRILRTVLVLLVLAWVLAWSPAAQAQDFRTIDPSGVWKGSDGDLTLMLTGDALSFTYSSVFGPSAHICDGAGVAGLVADNEYHYVDDQGTVSFVITENLVKMAMVDGIPYFCGANWPGEDFSRDEYTPPVTCRVSAAKAFFHVVMPDTPPEQRKAYLLEGDAVEVVPAQHEGGRDYVLARFKGPQAVTVGLFEKKALTCPK
jgi:hypothetical protein